VVLPVVVADEVAERRDALRGAGTHGVASSRAPMAGASPAGGPGSR
jgi:hypothetical protein